MMQMSDDMDELRMTKTRCIAYDDDGMLVMKT